MDASEIKDSKPRILEFIEKHKGELLLDFHEVVRLVGFDEDDQDYYYVLHSLKSGKYLESCVGALYPLKGVLPEKEYDCLVSIFDLNIKFALHKQKIEYLETALENLKKQGLSVGYVYLDPIIGTVDSTIFDTYEDAERVLNRNKDIDVRIVPIIDYEGDE
jgi:hypothetical protein